MRVAYGLVVAVWLMPQALGAQTHAADPHASKPHTTQQPVTDPHVADAHAAVPHATTPEGASAAATAAGSNASPKAPVAQHSTAQAPTVSEVLGRVRKLIEAHKRDAARTEAVEPKAPRRLSPRGQARVDLVWRASLVWPEELVFAATRSLKWPAPVE
jgi:cytoskeletal protein RodZ